MYDIIIVGAGPAGLTAAIYAARAEKRVLILEKETFGGQITYSPKVENYPGMISVSGNELAEKFIEQVMNLGIEIELAEVTGVRDDGYEKVVNSTAGEYRAKAVIIASGSKHRHLGVPGEENFIGEGVSFCAVCDGAFYKGKRVAVIGGGNTALQDAVLLSEGCASVTIVQNLETLTGEAKLRQILESRSNVSVICNTVVTEVCGGDKITSIKVKNTATGEESELMLDGVFVAIGQMPENEPFSSVASLNDYGYIVSGEDCLTKTPDVFVAGDCRTKAIRQVTTATADGAVAALAACRYIDAR
ncbi:MAG: FAD-dependent oxidoreductase [Clostridiales bacterium]|nr:FAD-dependent oxidoreductase [Clostridiales bacterium]